MALAIHEHILALATSFSTFGMLPLCFPSHGEQAQSKIASIKPVKGKCHAKSAFQRNSTLFTKRPRNVLKSLSIKLGRSSEAAVYSL